MPIRSMGSGAISFGLVSIPVNIYWRLHLKRRVLTFCTQSVAAGSSSSVFAQFAKQGAGEEITVSQPAPQRGNVIDLMEALKRSLGSVPKERKPALRAKTSETEKAQKKAQSGKK